MLLHIENSKTLPKTARTSTFVEGYNINTQKSVAFLYTNNELSERDIKKKSHLQLHQNNKIPGNKFNQGGERPVH